MNEETFLQKRKQSWLTLMELCDRADRSPTDLTRAQLIELFRLYRSISTDLAIARTISTSPSLISYLNDLTARAYSVVYRQPRQSLKKVLGDAVRLSVQTVRRRKVFIWASGTLFFGSGLLVFLLCHFSPVVHQYFLAQFEPTGMFEGWRDGNMPDRTGSTSGLMTGFYAANNPKVAIVTGAIGAGSFGFLSILMIAFNGAILGCLTNELIPVGRVGYLYSQITPHGVPEISGIIFSGACGLLLGWSLINPGKLTRGESLRAVGRDAITLLATSVTMMFIAAPIEGFFSYNQHIPGWLKASLAAISLAVWIFFWSTFAKDTDPIVSPDDPIPES